MSILTVYAEYDAEVNSNGYATYATAHDEASGQTPDDSYTWYNLGQDLSGGKYYIHRIGLHFDTSDLPDYCTILSATLTLYLYWDRIVSTDWDITVVDGADMVDPAVAADYGDFLDETTSYGTVSTASASSEGDALPIYINATGLAQISKTGTTTFALRSSRDIGSNVPTDRELYILFSRNEAEAQEYRPRLDITHSGTEASGPIKIVETRFHYVDKHGDERWLEGTVV